MKINEYKVELNNQIFTCNGEHEKMIDIIEITRAYKDFKLHFEIENNQVVLNRSLFKMVVKIDDILKLIEL